MWEFTLKFWTCPQLHFDRYLWERWADRPVPCLTPSSPHLLGPWPGGGHEAPCSRAAVHWVHWSHQLRHPSRAMARTAAAAAPSCREGEAGVQVQQLAAAGGRGARTGSLLPTAVTIGVVRALRASCHQLTVTLRLTQSSLEDKRADSWSWEVGPGVVWGWSWDFKVLRRTCHSLLIVCPPVCPAYVSTGRSHHPLQCLAAILVLTGNNLLLGVFKAILCWNVPSVNLLKARCTKAVAPGNPLWLRSMFDANILPESPVKAFFIWSPAMQYMDAIANSLVFPIISLNSRIYQKKSCSVIFFDLIAWCTDGARHKGVFDFMRRVLLRCYRATHLVSSDCFPEMVLPEKFSL